MEVIELSDDDDVIIQDIVKANAKKTKVFRCLNPDCRQLNNLRRASNCIRRYYGVAKYPKKNRICEKCYIPVKEYEDEIIARMDNGESMWKVDLRKPPDHLILSDSESDPTDDESSEDSEILWEASSGDEGKTIEEVMAEIYKDLDLEGKEKEYLKEMKEKLVKIQQEYDEQEAESKMLGALLNKVRNDFYDDFQPQIKWLPSLEIGEMETVLIKEPQVQIMDRGFGFKIETPEVDVMPIGDAVHDHKLSLPVGPLEYHECIRDETVFAMRHSSFARWVEAKIVDVLKRIDKDTTIYRILYKRESKPGIPHQLQGNQMAYFLPSISRLPVGTRVVAKFKDEDPRNSSISGGFYAGIVGEIPTSLNHYRYLIFFDDGYPQYISHCDIRVVTQSTAGKPWENVAVDTRDFIREYLNVFPERPMVRLQINTPMKTEWNGQWWKATVTQVDGSLAKIFFPQDRHSEWIYRGSTRLWPLFEQKMSKESWQVNKNTLRRRTVPIRVGGAVVEYGTYGQNEDDVIQHSGAESRAQTARKSTASSRFERLPMTEEVLQKVEDESKGTVHAVNVPERTICFIPHNCSHSCLFIGGLDGDSMLRYKGKTSILLFPLCFGWKRQLTKKSVRCQGVNFCISYIAPCGRRLRNIRELFCYLKMTESSLEIDCFSFGPRIDVLNEWEPIQKFLENTDISYGEENVPISCVNSLDTTAPNRLIYCNVRQPTQNVPLNLDPGFLVCCECDDDCQDKSKCACWQLTFEATKSIYSKVDTSVGYKFRRLEEGAATATGIFECNAKCQCKNSCLNRVVQHPLRNKLQLFMTARRGWGVRTLHDIPAGGFICIYVGKMLQDGFANEEGRSISGGDEYYAELDFIEVVEERIENKEGYEEDVIEPGFNQTSAGSSLNCSSDSCSEADNESGKPNEKDENFKVKFKTSDMQIGVRERSARVKGRETSRKSTKGKMIKKRKSTSSADVSEANSRDGISECDDKADEPEVCRTARSYAPQLLCLPKTEPTSLRTLYGNDEKVYVMDAKTTGNIGRYLNHSCNPNVFVQNVFVDTHDLRFPWIAFFANDDIKAGMELTWDYGYAVGSVPDKKMFCYCNQPNCRGRLL